MDLANGILDREATTASRQNNGLSEVRCFTLLLCVDSHHSKLFPDLLDEDVQAELHVNRDATMERILRLFVNFFD